jgi:hypothetical protein
MLPLSFTGIAPWMLVFMLAAGIIHHFISSAKPRQKNA